MFPVHHVTEYTEHDEQCYHTRHAQCDYPWSMRWVTHLVLQWENLEEREREGGRDKEREE